jgi:hypothetical protein
VTAGSGDRSLASTTAQFPLTTAGASRDTRPRSGASGGATMPTTPVGSGMVKLKYGAATGLTEPSTWCTLSDQPAYHTHRSMAASTPRSGSVAPATRTSSTNWSRRPSISSATRYSTWPRLYAVFADHPGNAARAARAASRRSFFEARATLARTSPEASVAG